MIQLVQFPWSPFCIVQRRILEYGRIPFRLVNIPSTDRTLVWKWTRQRYHGVPIIKHGRTVVFETNDDSQVIAKYLSETFQLGLFPPGLRGLHSILWRHIENEIEGPAFRLNDIYWREFVPAREQLAFLRHKERKFGRGCMDQWRAGQRALLDQLAANLLPFEQMLCERPFLLLPDRPVFADFDLFGMLGNFLHSGHYTLPRQHTCLRKWYQRISKIKVAPSP